MPGRLFLTTPISDLATTLGATADPATEDEPRLNIAPGENVRVLTPEHQLVEMRWGLIPVGRKNARGRPVLETIVNARSETVFDKSAFADVGRGVVPADGWYEWTGAKGRKTPWRISSKDKALVYFAAITDVWAGPGGIKVPQVATVTCEPNGDVRDIHHRMGALLSADEIETWLTAREEVAKSILRPLADGLLSVEKMSTFPGD
ncbi:MAG: SOS response-associated peptidase [Pseudomonadota bacterium]